MNRAILRTTLLLLGFRRISKYNYEYRRLIADPPQQYEFVHVVVYPYWFIGVVSNYGIKNFISPKKAWCYISKILEDYDQ